MIDKEFCMSSYMAFRYIEREDMDFYAGFRHTNIKSIPDSEKIYVATVDDIDKEVNRVFEGLEGKKLGILLSGGMDSAILAAYMRGAHAYTFRFLNGEYQKEELNRAEYYANQYGLELHYVDIDWNTVVNYLPSVMKGKKAPVHSIEPQLLQAALQAKKDGIEHLIIGESSDLIFGGMDQLLSKDWDFDEFKDRYIFTQPDLVLENPVDMSYLFERYRMGTKINFLSFLDDVYAIESPGSYMNAFAVADIPYTDPYAKLKMADPLDLKRIRNGEPKYLIRSLFAKKYPEIEIPDKTPMPRPVDYYFAAWGGPVRSEFKKDLHMEKFTGNQKWQMYCLEQFLDMYEGRAAST